MQDAQAAVDAQADRGVLLGPVDDGVVGPEAEPVVGGQGGDVVGDEEEDAQEGEEKPDGPHVAPVHRQLHLGATGEKVFSRMRPPRAPPRVRNFNSTCAALPPTCAHPWDTLPLTYSAADKVKVSELMEASSRMAREACIKSSPR